MSKPQKSVLIIGAPKSGTTSLAHWLNLRPDMAYIAGKEPRYFTDFGKIPWAGPGSKGFLASMYTNEAAYLQGFPDDPNVTWGIDGSTDYLWCEASADLIASEWANTVPTKLICVLRDPVDRALSEYQHTLRDGHETLGFQQSLEQEDTRFADHWQPLFYHRRRSLYLSALTRYAEIFGDDLLVLDYTELRDPETCLQKVERFLGVPEMATASSERQNASHSYKSPILGRIINNPAVLNAARAVVPPSMRSRVRGNVVSALSARFEPTAEDKAAIRALLSDEIAACVASDLIPTDNWRSALG